jgi:lipoate-protein ligase A
MNEEWRLLNTGAHDAYYNMGLDEAIVRARSNNLVPNTIRFFRWKPSAVSIGYFQSMVDEVDIISCKKRGIDYVRRITGGGAVYHDYFGELTYSIMVNEGHKKIPNDIIKSYHVLCSGLIIGMKLLGIPSEFKPINDIIVDGKKISGNAQTRRLGVIHQHGTILREVDPSLMFRLLRVPSEKIRDKLIKTVKDRVTSIKSYLYRDLSHAELEKNFKKGFEKALKIKLTEGEITNHEEDLAIKLSSKYSSKEWNFKR